MTSGRMQLGIQDTFMFNTLI